MMAGAEFFLLQVIFITSLSCLTHSEVIVVEEATCSVDIAFLMDASGSIGARDYKKQKRFIEEVASSFGISKTGSHAAVITYSDDAEIDIDFDDYYNIEDFINAVELIPYKRGRTRIDLALRLAHDRLFGRHRTAVNKLKMIVLMTDGQQTKVEGHTSLEKESEDLKRIGVRVLSVGIGPSYDIDELKAVVQDKENDVFEAASFDDLLIQAKDISVSSCKLIGFLGSCGKPRDVVFLMDASSSISKEDFEKQKLIVMSLTKYFGLSEMTGRVAVVAYGDNAITEINFDEFDTLEKFKSSVMKIKHHLGLTRIDKALTKANTIFSTDTKSREGVKRLVFALTDGEQSIQGDAISLDIAVLPLRRNSVKTFAVGFGGNVNRAQLRRIVENDDEVVIAKTYNRLLSDLQLISKNQCKTKTVSEAAAIQSCTKKVDLGFLVDASGSIGEYDFKKEKEFVKFTAKQFKISPEGSHAGVITYSDDARLDIKLADVSSNEAFDAAVDGIKYSKGRTRIDLALDMAQNELFTKENGMRDGVERMAIVLTDGQQTEKELLKKTIKSLENSQIRVIAVGIGASVDENELRGLTNDDGDLFLAKDFDELFEKAKILSSSTCTNHAFAEIRETDESEEKEEDAKCTKPLDIAFVMDASGSMTYEDYLLEKDFVKSFAQTLDLSPHAIHVGGVVYSSEASPLIPFADYTSIGDFMYKVDELPYYGYTTRIDRSLECTYQKLLNEISASRSQVPKVVMLLTNGQQTRSPNAKDLRELAKPLHDMGAKVFAIGVGPHVDKKELLKIAQYDERVLLVNTFKQLKNYKTKLSYSICHDEVLDVCRKPLDIAFIADLSSSANAAAYDKKKYFIKSMVDALDISSGSQIGLLEYSDKVDVTIPLQRYIDHEEFKKKLDFIPYRQGKRMFGDAFQLVKKRIFTEENGKSDNPKIVILITDGKQEKSSGNMSLMEAIQPLKDSGVKIFVVGVGDGVDTEELMRIVDSREQFMNPKNLDELLQHTMKITENTCKRAYAAPIVKAPVTECKKILDIAFLMDSSGSMGNHNYKLQKDFVNYIVKSIGITQGGSRAGVITYSDNALLDIPLGKYHGEDSFKNAVNNLPYNKGRTRIDLALAMAHNQMFRDSSPDVQKMVILMTDGKQTQAVDKISLDIAAAPLHQAGVEIFVVGVGKDVDVNELNQILLKKENLILSQTFAELNLKAGGFAKTACTGAVQKCTVPTDLGFLLDSSGSIGYENYQKIKDFIKDVAESFGISPTGTHAGVVVYSHKAFMDVKLSDNMNNEDFNKAVDKIKYLRYTTRIDLALKVANEQMFTSVGNMRDKSIPKILIIITDGRQTQTSSSVPLRYAVEPLHTKNVITYAVGIGDAVDRRELRVLVKSPKDVIVARNFDLLKDVLINVVHSTCRLSGSKFERYKR